MKLLNKDGLSAFFTSVERTMQFSLPPMTILGYHAVSHDKTIVDIDPLMFQKQLQILKNSCEFITLDQAG